MENKLPSVLGVGNQNPATPSYNEHVNQVKKNWQDTKADIESKKNEQKSSYEKPEVKYPENNLPTGKDESLADKINDINFTEEGAKQGDLASKSIQAAEMPKYKRATLKDILFDPQFEGKRDSLLANTIGTALGSGLARMGGTDLGAKSALQEYNETQAQNYAQMQADKDRRALDADISSRETLNAQKIALEANLADTIANTYLERYKAAQDAETKRQVLEQMAEDENTWAKLKDEEKINLASYMGILSGDYSLSSLLIQKYAPQLLGKFDQFMNKITNGQWVGGDSNPPAEGGEQTPRVKINSLGQEISEEDVETNPKKYIEIPIGGGKTEFVLKPTYFGSGNQREEWDKIADVILKNPNFKEENIEDAVKAYTGWELPKLHTLYGSLTEKMATAKKEAALKAKEEEQYNQAVYDNSQSLQDIRDNLTSGKLNGSQALEKLKKINQDLLDPQMKAVYDGVVGTASQKVIDEKYDEIKNGNLTTKDKIDEYNRLLEGEYSGYMTPKQKMDIERAKADAEEDYTVREPYQKELNKWYNTNTKVMTSEIGDYVSSKLGEDGLFYKQGTHDLKPIVFDPSTTDDITTSTNYIQTLLDLTEPNTIGKMVPGETIDEKLENIKKTPVYKAMAKFLGNKKLKGYADMKTKKDEKVYKYPSLHSIYQTLDTRFGQIMNGTLVSDWGGQ